MVFIILQQGLYLQKLSFSNITIKKIYIKWDEKLNISAQTINIQKSKKQNSTFDINDIDKVFKEVSRFLSLTQSVVIEKIIYNDTTLTLRYTQQQDGMLLLQSPSLKLQSHFELRPNFLLVDINELHTLNDKLFVDGKIFVDIKQKKLFSKLNISLKENARLKLYAIGDTKKLQYTIETKDKIKNLNETVALFNLPKEIHFWTIDAIDAPDLTLNKFSGFIQYDDMSNAYKNIDIEATLNKLNYTYNPKLDAIHTKETKLAFKKGVLYIYPQQAYSYGMYLDRSWLKIDFTKAQELLTLHLLFNGMLNEDMLHILDTYKIKLPFLQHSGTVETNLKLKVNLRTIKIDAIGNFYTKKANFDYLNLNINIANTLIKLHNYDVTIPKMQAQYKNIAKADIKVYYDTKNSIGSIDFKTKEINFDNKLKLAKTATPLHIRYNISPKGDSIDVDKSQWILKEKEIVLDALTIPFNLKKLQITIPTTYFKMKNIANGYLTGEIDMKREFADIDIDLLHLQYQGILLNQSNCELKFLYKQGLVKLYSKNRTHYLINGSHYKVEPFHLQFKNKHIILQNTNLFISKYIQTKINADYNLQTNKALINLDNFLLLNPLNKDILYYQSHIPLFLTLNKNAIIIKSPSLKTKFILNDREWALHIKSIDTIAQNSKFLTQYDLNDGNITLYKKDNESYTKFKGKITYKYKILTQKNKPIEDYIFKGYITKNQHIHLTINNQVNIKIADKINISLHNTGIYSEALLNFIDNILNKNNKETAKAPNIFFKAENSYIYLGNNRYILADKIDLQYYKAITTAQLQYRDGKAGFKLYNNKFHLYGENFNDTFMQALFSLSKFKGGSLIFSIDGTLKEYKGTFYIQKTTMQDYIILNNILAFINTIPSLTTFSLPGYNKDGLYVKNAYMQFHAKNHLFDISNIYLDSKELKMAGKGLASVKYDYIDLTLNLKTDLASAVSKIPVVGYIIFDGKSISTTLKITGKLTDPKINTMLAQDIVVAPLNIILRTLSLPYKLIQNISDLNDSKESKKK
jgi:hypothetical protein